jgi:NAD(P)-dependent dehydrogenase (short-subunit alcohol dehydrogenase family)
MPGRLQGRVAIITGGNSGIGEATANRFAQEGAKVAILARRVPEGKAVEQAIRGHGGDASFIPCDVTEQGSIEAAVAQTVATYGSLHVLFKYAGGGARGMFPEEANEPWEGVIKVNLTGTFLMCRAAWPHLIAAGGGAIINMSSLAAVYGPSDALRALLPRIPSASYSAAKAGIEALTRYVASVGARHHIRVNCVRPGQIETPHLIGEEGGHVFKRYFDVVQILPGAGRPEDVADAVLFLASDEARFITAEILNIDGGTTGKA